MVLLKYFAKEYKEDWLQEVDIVQGLSCGREPLSHLLHYRWHCKGELLTSNELFSICSLICSAHFLVYVRRNYISQSFILIFYFTYLSSYVHLTIYYKPWILNDSFRENNFYQSWSVTSSWKPFLINRSIPQSFLAGDANKLLTKKKTEQFMDVSIPLKNSVWEFKLISNKRMTR